jgi:excisionase family DNA binding protein
MEDRWLSVDEIAAYLGVKRDTIYKWIDEKSLPAHRLGRLWKFKKEEVDEWVRGGAANEGRTPEPPARKRRDTR